MLSTQPVSSAAEFTLKTEDSPRTLPPDLEREVERLWRAEQRKRDTPLFNGQLFSASHVTTKGIVGYIAEYRHFIAQQALPELFEHLKVRPVAVSGLLICAEGIVFGCRSRSLTQDAGLWELVPSGGVEAELLTPEGTIDYIAQTFVELQQETGLHAHTVTQAQPFCMVEDASSHVIDIGIYLRSPLSRDDIIHTHQHLASREYTALCIIALDELNALMQRPGASLVQVSTQLLHAAKEMGIIS